MQTIAVPVEDLAALREDPTCRQDRADRALDLIRPIEAVGGRRLDWVIFRPSEVCTDVPVVGYDGSRFTYAYPSEHRGVAILVGCEHGCGADFPVEVETSAHVNLLRDARWAHDCISSTDRDVERIRTLTDHIGRGTR